MGVGLVERGGSRNECLEPLEKNLSENCFDTLYVCSREADTNQYDKM